MREWERHLSERIQKEIHEMNTKERHWLWGDGVVCWNTRRIDFLADSNSSSAAVHHGLHKRSAIMIKHSGKKHASAPPPARLTATGSAAWVTGNATWKSAGQKIFPAPTLCLSSGIKARRLAIKSSWLQRNKYLLTCFDAFDITRVGGMFCVVFSSVARVSLA